MKKLIRIAGLSLIAISLFASCAGNKTETKKPSALEDNQVLIELNTQQNWKPSGEKITLTLYGYDKMLADKQATVIAGKEITLDELPKTVVLTYPQQPENLIQPKLSSAENAAYYLGLKDENQQISIDYNFAFPSVDISSKDAQIFYIKKM